MIFCIISSIDLSGWSTRIRWRNLFGVITLTRWITSILFENQGVKLEVNLKDETVWLTQAQMSELFGKAKSTINEHIKNIYNEGELLKVETMTKFGNSEFAEKPTNYYNLDMIISVGYRVKSKEGITFRKWATNN